MRHPNPFDEQRCQAQQAFSATHSRVIELQELLSWFDAFDKATEFVRLGALIRALEEVQSSIEAMRVALQEREDKAARFKLQAAMGFNPVYWFSSERAVAQRMYAQYLEQVVECQATLDAKLREAGELQGNLTAASHEFDRYCAEELLVDRHRSELESATASQEQLEAQLAHVMRAWQRAEKQLEPARNVCDLTRLERNDLKEKLARAERYGERLSDADNPRERALIHGECEAEFGEGSPRKLIPVFRKELAAAERALAKAEARLADTYRDAAREIRHVVIDGSNLLYRGGSEFIGPIALQAAADALVKANFKVLIVFDNGARGLLKLRSNRDVGALFGSDVEVRVVPHTLRTDEVILNIASEDPHAVVVSNDRFADYRTSVAVQEGRVLEHFIYNNSIQITALGITRVFSDEPSGAVG